MSESGRREDAGTEPKKRGDLTPLLVPAKHQLAMDKEDDVSRQQTAPKERRASSFSATNSPWFRRNSFLSSAMIENENFSVYESPSYYSHHASYNIISLNECQGFIFNQDLFALPYQQLRSIANERRYRASFSHPASASSPSRRSSIRGSVSGKRWPSGLCHPSQNESTLGTPPPGDTATKTQRRHTSYLESRPTFLRAGVDSAVEFDADETEDDYHIDNDAIDEAVDGIAMDILSDEEVEVDEYDEFEGIQYGGQSASRGYKVHVTEIVVNENDNSIFPTADD